MLNLVTCCEAYNKSGRHVEKQRREKFELLQLKSASTSAVVAVRQPTFYSLLAVTLNI